MHRLLAAASFLTYLAVVLSYPACSERCDISLGAGTECSEPSQKLYHNARFPFVANLTCEASLGVPAKASFLYTDYFPLEFNGTSAKFKFYLEPWKSGLLRFYLSDDCHHDWFLITGYSPETSLAFECHVPLKMSHAADICLSRQDANIDDVPPVVICHYSLGKLFGPAISRDLMDQLEVDVTAMNCLNSTQNTRHHCYSMDCNTPGVNGSGVCVSCNRAEAFSNTHISTLTAKNIFGSASVQREFSTISIAVLPEPRYSFNMSIEKRSVLFSFCVGDQEKVKALCSAWNSMQYRVIARQALSQDSFSSSKAFDVVCNVCDTSCNNIITNMTETSGSCIVRVSGLFPTAQYVYEASWRISDGREASPWSKPTRGSFDFPEDVPDSSPTFVENGFSEQTCSVDCHRKQRRDGGSCRELTLYWQSIPAPDRNGELTAIRLQTVNQTIFLPRNSKNYTICTTADADQQMWLTAENAKGAPAFSKWTIIRIPGPAQRLPPVTDIIVKAGPSAGFVQLWWRYAQPADRITIFWTRADDELNGFNWTTVELTQLQRNGLNKWTYVLGPERFKDAAIEGRMNYGIGVAYGNLTSGLTFNRLCTFYDGNKAPEVEVVGAAEASTTTAIIDVKLSPHQENACSFAGPLIGFEVKLVDHDASSSNTRAICDNCLLATTNDSSAYRYSRSIKVSQLLPNHKYVIMFRSVVDAGDEEVRGTYSLPVYVRTSGLTITETSGVVIGTLSFCVCVFLVAISLRRCHRAIGLGQTVHVPVIRRHKYSGTEEFTMARSELMQLLTDRQNQTINHGIDRVVTSSDYAVFSDLWTLNQVVDHAAFDRTSSNPRDEAGVPESSSERNKTLLFPEDSCFGQSQINFCNVEPFSPHLSSRHFGPVFSCPCSHHVTSTSATAFRSRVEVFGGKCHVERRKLAQNEDFHGETTTSESLGTDGCNLPSDYFQTHHSGTKPAAAGRNSCLDCSDTACWQIPQPTKVMHDGSLESSNTASASAGALNDASTGIILVGDQKQQALSTRDMEGSWLSTEYVQVSSLQAVNNTSTVCLQT